MLAAKKQYFLSFITVLFLALIISVSLSGIVHAVDPYTAESNGGSCKTGDTAYDDTTSTPGVVKKMCKPADAAVPDPTAAGAADAQDPSFISLVRTV